MPIRFRCEHCNQLLGIAHRKAGMTVGCPNCKRPVIVPPASREPAPAPGKPPPAPMAFERSNFDDMFRDAPSLAGADVPVHPAEGAARVAALPDVYQVDVEPYQPGEQLVPAAPAATPAAGIVISPLALTILTVVVIVLIGLAFLVGVFVGAHYLAPGPVAS